MDLELVLSISISGAALIFSTLSPIITAKINSHAQSQERENLFYLQHRAETIENYVRHTGQYLRNKTMENAALYGAACGEALVYLAGEVRNDVIALDDMITTSIKTSPQEIKVFNRICAKLSEQSPRTKYKRGKRNV